MRLPPMDKLVAEMNKFVNCKGDGVETVKEPVSGKKQRAR